jgi:N-acyl-D-aspartate/D-glutamate deacylase
LALEDAIKELTGRQAQLLNLSGRGIIIVGAAADLTIFDPAELAWEPETLTWDLPGGGWRLRRPSGGYRYTITAGVLVQQEGELTHATPARDIAPG